MPPEYGRQTRDISGVYDQTLIGQLCDSLLHVDGVPVRDGIESEAKAPQLLFLSLAQGVTDFSPLSMVDFPGQLVAEFLTVELHENPAPKGRVVDVVEDVQGLDEATQLHEARARVVGRSRT